VLDPLPGGCERFPADGFGAAALQILVDLKEMGHLPQIVRRDVRDVVIAVKEGVG
jgi:hypothetical protein